MVIELNSTTADVDLPAVVYASAFDAGENGQNVWGEQSKNYSEFTPPPISRDTRGVIFNTINLNYFFRRIEPPPPRV